MSHPRHIITHRPLSYVYNYKHDTDLLRSKHSTWPRIRFASMPMGEKEMLQAERKQKIERQDVERDIIIVPRWRNFRNHHFDVIIIDKDDK